MQKSLIAEFLGTFWLVLGGCGSAVLAAAFPELGIGFVGVAMAFGLTVLTMAYAVGGISGGHFNPAVSVGLTIAGKLPAGRLLPYIVVQVLGAIAAARRASSWAGSRQMAMASIRRAASRCFRRWSSKCC
jgi:aquaporin Z